jgi:hypothetical protein
MSQLNKKEYFMLTEAVSSIRALEEALLDSVDSNTRPDLEKRIAELKAKNHFLFCPSINDAFELSKTS